MVSHFFISAFADRPPRSAGIDVGSGTNLYPALLMLPWTEQILLADFSESNVSWLHGQLADDTAPWPWRPFWQEMREAEGYSDVGEPRKRLREACVSEPGYAGIEQLQRVRPAQGAVGPWHDVLRRRVHHRGPGGVPCRGRALHRRAEAGRPVRGGLHGGLGRVPGGRAPSFPALPITPDDVRRHLHRARRKRAQRGTASRQSTGCGTGTKE